MRINSLVIVFLLAISLQVSGREIVSFSVKPNTGEDCTKAMNVFLEDLKNNPRAVELKFEKGRYDFYGKDVSEITFGEWEERCLFLLSGIDSLSINGNGSQFILHGIISMFIFNECKGITVENFTIDWERTIISQGRVENVTPDYVDISFDRKQYPYYVKDGKIIFTGEDWEADVSERSFSTIYDGNTRNVLQGTKDEFLSRKNELFRGNVKELNDTVVRFYGHPDTTVPEGSFIALYHGIYLGNLFFQYHCADMKFKDIDVYHAPGASVLAYFVDNLLIENFNIRINRERGRCFSTMSDGFHLTNCRGKVEIKNCLCEGQGDDAANINGQYMMIKSVSADKRRIVLGGDSRASLIAPHSGDNIWPIESETVSRSGVLIVDSVLLDDIMNPVVVFNEPVPDNIGAGDFLEYADWYPDVTVHGCSFLHTNRARGILLTTAKSIRVFDNYFSTSGASILIEGDINYWYESGSISDLDINNNVFDNCATSVRDTITYWGWGEAVITITPSFQPTDADSPAYHHNIRIRNNKFYAFDDPLLFARSVSGLEFSRNTIIPTSAFPKTLVQQNALSLDGCRKVRVVGNKGKGSFGKLTYDIHHMRPDDIFIR